MDFALWPAHPQILPGEILSSWLVRIAHSNGFQAREFAVNQLLYDREIWRRDIDHLAPQRLIALLARKTGFDVKAIERTTLRSYEGLAFERFIEYGATRWILQLGIQGRTRRLFGQQYCPLCLAADPVPYLRLRWRMAFQMVCALHGVLLSDQCPSCARALAPYRLNTVPGVGRNSQSVIRLCWYCHTDLASLATPVDAEALRIQRGIDAVIDRGYAEVGGTPIYSHLFLDGVRHLMTGLNGHARKEQHGRVIFESQRAVDRLARMCEAFDLLDDWPHRLLKQCRDLPQPFSRFVRQGEVMPWWLWSVLRRSVFRAQSELREDEAKSILDATEKIIGRRSGAQARKLSGRNVSRDEPRDYVTEDEVDALIAHMDRRIAVSLEAQRLRLLRDKVIFLVARRRHLGASALAAMTVYEAARDDDYSGAFWCNARRPGDVERIVGWYLCNVRPAIAPNCKSESLFVSRSGQGMSRVAIAANMKSAVHAAGMRGPLASVSCWSLQLLS